MINKIHEKKTKISKRNLLIYSEFYTHKTKNKIKYLTSLAFNFGNAIKILETAYTYEIDEVKLQRYIEYYYNDIIKYKDYRFNSHRNCSEHTIENILSYEWSKNIHEGSILGETEAAAYLTKWLLKANPISLFLIEGVDPTENQKIIAYNINQLYALACVLDTLNIKNIPPDEYTSLIYDFSFRSFDEKNYFSRYRLLIKLEKLRIQMNEMQKKLNHKDKKQVTLPKTSPKNQYNIFIAGPGDVDSLRDATIETFNEFDNTPFHQDQKLKFTCWDWRKQKRLGEYKDKEDFQKRIFDEFGDKPCDIFIILLWTKIKKGTKMEYDYYHEKWKKENPDILFWGLKYAPNIHLNSKQTKSKCRLDKWLEEKNFKHWSKFRCDDGEAISNEELYKKALRNAILTDCFNKIDPLT